MHWAKTQSSSQFNLASSGMLSYPITEFEILPGDLEITSTDTGYGYTPLLNCIANKCSVPAECVVTALGTSFANHLAMAAVLDPGDEVLIEHPAYDPLLSVARHLGGAIKRFHVRMENGFQVDLEELRRLVTARTRLIVISNLHNPTSALLEEDALLKIGAIA